MLLFSSIAEGPPSFSLKSEARPSLSRGSRPRSSLAHPQLVGEIASSPSPAFHSNKDINSHYLFITSLQPDIVPDSLCEARFPGEETESFALAQGPQWSRDRPQVSLLPDFMFLNGWVVEEM